MRRTLLLIVILALAGFACREDDEPENLEPGLVRVDGGLVRGVREGDVFSFRGIPFAAPPTGDLRWKSPEAPIPWKGERLADAFGPACPQIDGNNVMIGDEDCLHINVWTPIVTADDERTLPVLVFIHGGGNVQGSTSIQAGGVALYDGQRLAEAGQVVVVTLNYRLGTLGFLAHASLSAESEYGGSGNYGLLDQVRALDWIHRLIAGFGGDTSRVLVFGESAGAVNTCSMLASPLTDGLFTRALMESGGCVAEPLATRESEGATVAATVGCNDAACLRGVGTEALVRAIDTDPIGSMGLVQPAVGATIDGYVLTQNPRDALASADHHDVPFVVGANSDETGAWIGNLTQQQYEDFVHAVLGQTIGDQALAVYPAANFATPRLALVAMTTDAQFVCPSRTWAASASASQSSSVYRYFFTHSVSVLGATHGLELPFLFQRTDIGGYQPTAADLEVSAAMLSYWTRFADTGDPNGGSNPAWPVYDPSTDPYMEIAAPPAAGAAIRTNECDFWDSLTL